MIVIINNVAYNLARADSIYTAVYENKYKIVFVRNCEEYDCIYFEDEAERNNVWKGIKERIEMIYGTPVISL